MIEEDLIEVSSSSLCARGGRRPCPWHRTRVPGAAFGSGGDEDARLVSRASKVNASRPEPVRRVTCWFVKSAVSSRVVGGTSPSSSPARRARFVAGHEVARPLQPEPHAPFRVAFHARASDSTTTTIAIRGRRRRSLAAIVVTRSLDRSSRSRTFSSRFSRARELRADDTASDSTTPRAIRRRRRAIRRRRRRSLAAIVVVVVFGVVRRFPRVCAASFSGRSPHAPRCARHARLSANPADTSDASFGHPCGFVCDSTGDSTRRARVGVRASNGSRGVAVVETDASAVSTFASAAFVRRARWRRAVSMDDVSSSFGLSVFRWRCRRRWMTFRRRDADAAARAARRRRRRPPPGGVRDDASAASAYYGDAGKRAPARRRSRTSRMAPYDAGADTSLPDGFTRPRLPDRRSMTVNVERGGRQAGSAFRRSLSLCIYRVRRPRVRFFVRRFRRRFSFTASRDAHRALLGHHRHRTILGPSRSSGVVGGGVGD